MSKWFEKYPAVYRDEIDTLQNGFPGFQFIAQLDPSLTGNWIAVKGTLTYGGTNKQEVRIVFPPLYPFSPAIVVPITTTQVLLGNNIVQRQESPVFFPSNNQFRSDNPLINGKLCLFEDEKNWIPFHDGVAKVLRRAIEWLEGVTAPGGFRPDQVVAESLPLFGPYAGQVIFYKSGNWPEAPKGRMLLKRFKDDHYSLLELHFDIENGKGAIDCFPEGTPLSEVKQEVMLSYWYRIEGTALSILPSFVQPQGGSISNSFMQTLMRISNRSLQELLPSIDTGFKEAIIGLRFDDNDLHFFRIKYRQEGAAIRHEVAYLLPKDLSCELFARVDSLFDINYFSQRKVVVIGAGAIGSEVLKELAACGIGNFVLIDEETFDAGNTVRHAADLRSLSEKKVLVLKEIIQCRNPKAKVTAASVDLFNVSDEDLDHYLQGADLVLDMTASRQVEYFLHHKVFVEKGLPVLQAASSRGGLTSAILLMVPDISSCLQCLKSLGADHVPTSGHDLSAISDTLPAYGVCSKPALPAAGIDTRETALQAARVVLQFIGKGFDKLYPALRGYQFYWHGPAGGVSVITGNSKDAYEWEIHQLTCEENCQQCNQKK